MKYNLSKIMKRAWGLVKEMGMTISSGLKKAWKEVKTVEYNFKGSEKQVKYAQDIIKKTTAALDAKIEEFQAKERENTRWRWDAENFEKAKKEMLDFFAKTEKAGEIIESKYRGASTVIREVEEEIEARSCMRRIYGAKPEKYARFK